MRLFLQSVQGAILASIIVEKYPSLNWSLTVACGYVLYELLAEVYPIIRQIIMLKSFNLMIISLNPRYYNIEVVRKERELRIYPQRQKEANFSKKKRSNSFEEHKENQIVSN